MAFKGIPSICSWTSTGGALPIALRQKQALHMHPSEIPLACVCGARRAVPLSRSSSTGDRSHLHMAAGESAAASSTDYEPDGLLSSQDVFWGFDFGTSGARVAAIDSDCRVLFTAKKAYKEECQKTIAEALDWKEVLFSLLKAVPLELRQRTAGISLDATSSTIIMVERATGRPIHRPVMYNESCNEALPAVKSIAPPNHTVTSGTSTLCKLVSWWEATVDSSGQVELPPVGTGQATGQNKVPAESVAMCHQADWLLHQLLEWNGTVRTDYNNALKLGYDPGREAYPDWLSRQPFAHLFPEVVAPGAPVGALKGSLSSSLGIPASCRVCAGTTDSIAAFLAAQVHEPGQAVTSLGSTLAVKLLSTVRVDDARYGLYSHRLGDKWLVGGASNTGGAVLRNFFPDDRLRALSESIDPTMLSPLDYYPLLKPGERFPVSDPSLEPRLSPRPDSDAEFLHGMLEGMARIEAQGYKLLQELGATPLTFVATAGGGSQNPVWSAIRERVIGVPVVASENTDAAYGAALLALKESKTVSDMSR